MIADKYMGILNASLVSDDEGGVDTQPLFENGVPVMVNLIADNDSHDFYFQYHHSAGDSMTMMNPDDLDSNVVGVATMFYILADLDSTIPRTPDSHLAVEKWSNIKLNQNTLISTICELYLYKLDESLKQSKVNDKFLWLNSLDSLLIINCYYFFNIEIWHEDNFDIVRVGLDILDWILCLIVEYFVNLLNWSLSVQ